MQYRLPLRLCGSSIRSMPTFFHVSDTGIGCSMGEGLSNFLLLLWQISHRLTCVHRDDTTSIQHNSNVNSVSTSHTPPYLYTKLTHKCVIPSHPHHYWFSSSSISVRLWMQSCHVQSGILLLGHCDRLPRFWILYPNSSQPVTRNKLSNTITA